MNWPPRSGPPGPPLEWHAPLPLNAAGSRIEIKSIAGPDIDPPAGVLGLPQSSCSDVRSEITEQAVRSN
jgi:hypothetical protein